MMYFYICISVIIVLPGLIRQIEQDTLVKEILIQAFSFCREFELE